VHRHPPDARRRLRPAAPLTALATVATAIVAGAACGSGDPPLPPGHATVVSVIDGDTIVARVAGRDERIRLIGIDTPETVAPGRPVECFGPEATARARELLAPGAVVLLERDVEARDRYDRLLAYVTTADGTSVNRVLVAEGYAEASAFPPNTALDAELAGLESEARRAGEGLWSACVDR
jgi:micrococcal nuclease